VTVTAAPIAFDPVAVTPPDGEWHVGERHFRTAMWDVTLTKDWFHQVPIPLYLWHYTSRAALGNILRTRCLWARHLLRLEDQREFRFAGEVLRSVLDQVMDEETAPEIRDAVLLVQQLIEKAPTDETPHLYVISFTTRPDNPNMWRLHTRGSDAPVSIGIEGMYLVLRSMENWQLRKVFYHDQEQREWIHRVLDIHLNRLKDGVSPETVIPNLARAITVLAPVLKSREFEEEEEWRMIHYPNWYIRHPEAYEPTVYDPKENPHIILPFDNLLPPIRITVGPGRTCHPDDENDLVAMAAKNRILAIVGRSGCLTELPYEVGMVALHNSSLEE
jgi:hypothetical protein